MTSLDPRFDPYLQQLVSAFGGGGAPISAPTSAQPATPASDAATIAAAMLAAYPHAAAAQPAKAFQPGKSFSAELTDGGLLQDPTATKNWLDDVVSIAQSVGPVVVQMLSKDYTPPAPDIKTVIDSVPESRRSDPDFANYASTLALTVAQSTVQAMGGSGAPAPDAPVPPEGKDKAWYNDVLHTVASLAPTVLPIALACL